MMKLFNFISKKRQLERKREMLNYLQSMSVDKIERLGFSTTLVQQGMSAWAWRKDDQPSALEEIDQMIVEEQCNVAKLMAYTNAELHDLGISRGLIKHAVRTGRVGIDEAAIVRAA